MSLVSLENNTVMMPSSIRRSFEVFWLYTLQSIRISLQQRVGAVFFVFGKLVRFAMFGVFVYFLLQNTTTLAGYTLSQTLIFFITFNIIDGISQLLFRQVYRFRPLVISGDFDLVLVKPVHPFLRVLIGGVDILDVIPLLLYGGILVYLLAGSPDVTVLSLVMYIFLVMNALVIATGFHILVLALGITSTEVDHTIMIYRDISRLGLFPVDIYAQPIRFIVTFIVPIGVMVSVPVEGLLGLLTFDALITTSIVTVMFTIGSLIAWKMALARYCSASS